MVYKAYMEINEMNHAQTLFFISGNRLKPKASKNVDVIKGLVQELTKLARELKFFVLPCTKMRLILRQQRDVDTRIACEIRFAVNISPSIANHVKSIFLLGSILFATGIRDVA